MRARRLFVTGGSQGIGAAVVEQAKRAGHEVVFTGARSGPSSGEAGKLGANAIVLNDIGEPGTGERIASAVFDISSPRRGEAMAIYVPPGDR